MPTLNVKLNVKSVQNTSHKIRVFLFAAAPRLGYYMHSVEFWCKVQRHNIMETNINAF